MAIWKKKYDVAQKYDFWDLMSDVVNKNDFDIKKNMTFEDFAIFMENMTLGEKYDFWDLMSNAVKKYDEVVNPKRLWTSLIRNPCMYSMAQLTCRSVPSFVCITLYEHHILHSTPRQSFPHAASPSVSCRHRLPELAPQVSSHRVSSWLQHFERSCVSARCASACNLFRSSRQERIDSIVPEFWGASQESRDIRIDEDRKYYTVVGIPQWPQFLHFPLYIFMSRLSRNRRPQALGHPYRWFLIRLLAAMFSCFPPVVLYSVISMCEIIIYYCWQLSYYWGWSFANCFLCKRSHFM